jgi:nucleoside-diphosphate-sugar epimerase
LLPPLYQGILAVVERTGARYVVTDNLYMYGQANGRMTEETPNGATDSKGQLRARLADDVLEAHTAGRVRASILRASDFYGPDFENGLLSIKAIRAILSGKPVQVLGDPDRLHTFSFVPDVARALAILGANPHGDGQIWHVPSPVALTTRATLELAAQIAGKPLRLKVARRGLLTVLGIAMPLMRELTKTLYQWENDYVMDSSKFEAAFGMHATSLEDGLRSTVNWTEKNSNAAPVVIQRAV